jgi:hypothetical protein
MDYLTRFDAEYLPKLGARAPTMRAIVAEACRRGCSNIVETGSIRQEGNWAGDGQSTVIWDDMMTALGGSITTIDLSREAIDMAERLAPNAFTLCMDSVSALKGHPDPIDLLYLDSFDLDMTAPPPATLFM